MSDAPTGGDDVRRTVTTLAAPCRYAMYTGRSCGGRARSVQVHRFVRRRGEPSTSGRTLISSVPCTCADPPAISRATRSACTVRGSRAVTGAETPAPQDTRRRRREVEQSRERPSSAGHGVARVARGTTRSGRDDRDVGPRAPLQPGGQSRGREPGRRRESTAHTDRRQPCRLRQPEREGRAVHRLPRRALPRLSRAAT